MAECRYKLREAVGRMSADSLVLLSLLLWLVLNIVQAAAMDLCNDEAYYWYYSRHLDWGYFDHPPMVALLVKLSQWLPGTLGVRFFSVLLQPAYLYIFWRLIRPGDARRRDAMVFVLACFSQPLLQLYGFLALPDAPLMMSTVVFLWSYKRFLKEGNMANGTMLGVAVALLGYSKYHGVLVVALVLLSNPTMFKRWQLYWGGLVALLLFLPHLWWQWEHDWVSVRYHLVGRNAWEYRSAYTWEYLATVLVLFNPLWLYHYGKGLWGRMEADADGAWRRSLKVLSAGFVLFFLVATVRGRVQAQWLLPVVLPLTAALMKAGRESRYVSTVGMVSAVLFIAVRVMAIANPMQLKGEVWRQRQVYAQMAEAVGDRPLQLMNSYARAAKYAYYTGKEVYCAPYYFSRHSQWQYDTTDRTFMHREVVVADFGEFRGEELPLADGRVFTYCTIRDFFPMRELQVESLVPIDFRLTERDSLGMWTIAIPVAVYNPYPYDIVPTEEEPVRMRFYVHTKVNEDVAFSTLIEKSLKARDTTVLQVLLKNGRPIPDGVYPAGFAVGYKAFPPSDSSPKIKLRVEGGHLVESE